MGKNLLFWVVVCVLNVLAAAIWTSFLMGEEPLPPAQTLCRYSLHVVRCPLV